jgi:hypothetical protein
MLVGRCAEHASSFFWMSSPDRPVKSIFPMVHDKAVELLLNIAGRLAERDRGSADRVIEALEDQPELRLNLRIAPPYCVL